jgi:superfamily II DNA/RNA helicase
LSLTLVRPEDQASPLAIELAEFNDAPEQATGDLAAETAEFSGLSFHELGLKPEIVKTLDKLGIATPFPIQAMTIADALAGRDICGKAKTGSGKTLAFGLPVIQMTTTARKRRPRALILVPTRELANQVADALTPFAAACELWVTAIYGGASMVRQIKALHAGVDVVIATPGRLNDLLERKEMSVADVTMVVLDEADQMADMGFLPQVRQILDQIDGEHQTLLFSATLDGSIGELVKRYQHDPVTHQVASETDTVDTLDQRFIGVERPEKVRVAAQICDASDRTIVFVRTKHGADNLARQLGACGVNAQPIHGGLNQNRRERTLQDFASGRAPVLVATNVAARGIHVDGIDTVLHFDLPEDGKTYLHRSGRTARAGSDGLVVTLVSPEETYDARSLQREAGINLSIVPMSPGDERLKDLSGFEPPMAPPVEAPRSTYRNNRGPVPAAGPRGNGGGGGRGPRRPWQGNRGGYGGNNRRDR